MAASFNKWLSMVNRILSKKFCGMTIEDLPDFCWYDLWSNGDTPQQAVQSFVEEAL